MFQVLNLCPNTVTSIGMEKYAYLTPEWRDIRWVVNKVIQFCKDHGYTYEFVENKFYGLPFEVNDMISKEGVKDYMKSICKYDLEITKSKGYTTL